MHHQFFKISCICYEMAVHTIAHANHVCSRCSKVIQSSFSMRREPCNIYINTRKIYWHNHVNAVCCSRMGPAPHQVDRFFQNMRYACRVYFRRSLPSLATVEFKFSRKSMKLARPCSCHAHVWILHHTSFKYSRLNLDLTLQQRCEVIFVCLFGWVLVI